ncbi:Actin patches distal protein 1 [Golovinomyces cichoracearum]|uniref:Actin patches distal protein 1 n=1 Tax=Golovinomyces cichoracearum TaxID=62708 RepID=A0A420I931_9PEZI|nr:Actin patches distal protein 1 [Golovinomyces cichoracearum]
MAAIINSLVNFVGRSQPDKNPVTTDSNGSGASMTQLFPKVDKKIDGEDCDQDCTSCVLKYPKSFKIDEDDELYGKINAWSTHLLVATGKSDWVRNIADEEGSIMETMMKLTDVKPNNGYLMLSASNMPTPSNPTDYADPTTVLLLPAWLIIDNVTPKSVDTLISEFVNKSPTNSTAVHKRDAVTSPKQNLLKTVGQLSSRPCPHSALILLCSHGTRDARCGQSAPLLRKEFERHLREYGLFRDLDDERPGGVGIYFISHVGGHKYAANVMVYRKENAFGLDKVLSQHSTNEPLPQPRSDEKDGIEGAAQCIRLARVKPEDCMSIVKFTILKGKVVKPEKQLMGGFDRSRGLYSW